MTITTDQPAWVGEYALRRFVERIARVVPQHNAGDTGALIEFRDDAKRLLAELHAPTATP